MVSVRAVCHRVARALALGLPQRAALGVRLAIGTADVEVRWAGGTMGRLGSGRTWYVVCVYVCVEVAFILDVSQVAVCSIS